MAAQGSDISREQLGRLLRVTRMLTVTTDLDALLQCIAEATCDMLDCERASIFLHDAKSRELWTKVALGSREIRVPDTSGIVGAAFTSNTLIHVPDPYQDPRFNPEPDRQSGFRTRSLLTVPTGDASNKPIGVLQAVNKRGPGFTADDLLLGQALADSVGVAIQRYMLQQQAIEGAELRREMTLARDVQDALIPREPPQVPGLLCAGYTRPASITGGDGFDYWMLPDGRLAFFLGDAAGHGIAPAMIVAQARTLLRALAEIDTNPHWLMCRVNSRAAADMAAGRFVTIFFGVLSPDGILHWSSGGHGPILLQRRCGGPVELLEPSGPPIGVVDPFLGEQMPPIEIEQGGRVVVLSDGLFEAFSPAGEQLGVDRIVAVVERSTAPPADLIRQLQSLALQWQQHDEPMDDQTAVVVQRL
ncbi:MAG: SpoIIE family protein phosphatase [Phycisphaerae bacterium]|nr:SpoIIE family protein phosphatase [Phycisphaerae bacterium]MDW8262813.1 SpoIIE family protein phosphatase [Phycisphaerales bacterium]